MIYTKNNTKTFQPENRLADSVKFDTQSITKYFERTARNVFMGNFERRKLLDVGKSSFLCEAWRWSRTTTNAWIERLQSL